MIDWWLTFVSSLESVLLEAEGVEVVRVVMMTKFLAEGLKGRVEGKDSGRTLRLAPGHGPMSPKVDLETMEHHARAGEVLYYLSWVTKGRRALRHRDGSGDKDLGPSVTTSTVRKDVYGYYLHF
jgi:hypothetical protein